MICDKSPDSLRRAKQAYPDIVVTTEAADVIRSPDIDAVAVITPVWTHYELAEGRARERQARLRRKAVHVERRTGGRTDRAGGSKDAPDHGGPHLPVHRRGAEDPAADR